MLNKIVNGITKGGYVVFDHIPDHVIVNVKIPMGNAVAHAHNSMPRYFWT